MCLMKYIFYFIVTKHITVRQQMTILFIYLNSGSLLGLKMAKK